MIGKLKMKHSRHGAQLLVAMALVAALVTFLPVGFADNPPALFVVTQDQAPLTFYQDGKLTGVEPLAKGTYIRAESIAADRVLTTYKGKAAYIQLKFLTAQESVLIVTVDNCELFYYNDAGPTGLERLPKGTQITVEKRSSDQVFTTYRGKPAYLKSQFLITPQEFAAAMEKEATEARAKVEQMSADAHAQAEKVLAEKMDRDIKQLRTRVLNPKNSSAVGYYDQVITSEFRPFLANYPNSPYEAEVTGQIKEWQAERDRVASGLMKYNCDWVSKANFDKYRRWDQALALYREGDQLVAQTNWPAAVQKFDAVLALNPGGGTEIATKRQLAMALKKWLATLPRDVKISDRLANARKAFQQAQAAFRQPQASPVPANKMGGNSDAPSLAATRAENAKIRSTAAQEKLNLAQAELDAAQAENDAITRTMTQARQRLAQVDQTITQPEVATADQAPAGPTSTESPDVITMIQTWFKHYWPVAGGIALLGLFIVTRLFR